MAENRSRPENWMALAALALAALCGCGNGKPAGPPPAGRAATVKEPVADAYDWPTREAQLPWAARTVTRVLRATATEAATLGERSGAHMSTSMKLGDETIKGGGNVFYAKCHQKFRVAEAIKGAAGPKEFVLDYSIVEKSDCFPGPRASKPIPANAPVILLLGDKDELLKALRDTPENLKAVREALAAADVKRCQEPFPFSPLMLGPSAQKGS